MIEYKKLIWDEEQIMNLYLDNKWYNYTNNKERLFKGIKNSLDVIAAYDGKKLVGLIRTIGDASTIVYILDILILEEYHRQGIGSYLMIQIIDKYEGVLHIQLTTDTSEKTANFYRKLGFKPFPEIDAVGFKYFPPK